MARKPSREALELELERSKREATVQAIALQAILEGEIPIQQVATIGKGEAYSFGLYRARSAHGGVVVQVFLCEGQRPSVSVNYLDRMQYPVNTEYLPLNVALERLRIARQKALDSEGYAN
jgi:hypothetical protein